MMTGSGLTRGNSSTEVDYGFELVLDQEVAQVVPGSEPALLCSSGPSRHCPSWPKVSTSRFAKGPR